MKIHVASDHAGYGIKEFIKNELFSLGYDVVDHGPKEMALDDDYPDFVTPCAQSVTEDKESLGIVVGGSGQGEAMCANRIKGIYAGVYYGGEMEIIETFREHNNANVLSLGARFIDNETALLAVKTFLNTKFSGDGRHIRRLAKY